MTQANYDWLTTVCQRRFMPANKSFWRVVQVTGEATYVWEQEVHGKSLHIPFSILL